MVSSTQQTSRIRRRKSTTNGKWNKRSRRAFGTPAFPVHQAGYDQSAPDAKKPEAAKPEGGKLVMANHPSAEKRNRQRVAATERNRAHKSSVRTKLKVARAAVAGTDVAAAKASVVEAERALDKAASKGAVHPKAASRKKARLAKALHKASAATKLTSAPLGRVP
jgi:small subunit ribosomal protein S20